MWTFTMTPMPPSWKIDWRAIEELFPWFSAMSGCPQHPVHHMEGDVQTHTKLVCEELASMRDWRALPEEERNIVFLAALLHDVAKPACTTGEGAGISSESHTRLGQKMTRHILWRGPEFVDIPAPLSAREQVAWMVRLSGLPLWLLERQNPRFSIIRAGQVVRCDLLALLEEADVRGRICPDRGELLERVQLFREFAEEQHCLAQPRPFPSPHSCFTYFNNARLDADPDRLVYDDTEFSVTVLSGLPGAGKDHWIRRHAPNSQVISLDAIRLEMGIPSGEPQGQVVHEARRRARDLMRARQSFVWSATNVTRFMRQPLIDRLAEYGASIRLVYVEPPCYAALLAQNAGRAHPVPNVVLDRLAGKLEVPDLTEAHAVLWEWK